MTECASKDYEPNGKDATEENGESADTRDVIAVPVSNRFSPLNTLQIRPPLTLHDVLSMLLKDNIITQPLPKYNVSLLRKKSFYDSIASSEVGSVAYGCVLRLEQTRRKSKGLVLIACRCRPELEIIIKGQDSKTFQLPIGLMDVEMSRDRIEGGERTDLNIVYKVTIAYHEKKKNPRVQITDVTKDDTDEEESLELPMADEFEYQIACPRCAVINKRYNCSVHPDVHQDGVPCDKNVLLARRKKRRKTVGSDWCRIRVGPLKNPRLKSAKAPRLCKAVQEAANTCDRGVNCSFAHSEVELKLWKAHINSQVPFSILKLWKRLCRDSRPKDVIEDIKRWWCGNEANNQFFFACPQCLSDGWVKQSCGDHGLPLQLMFGCPNYPPDADAMPVPIREPGAPNPELIEEDVWQFVDGEGVPRKALLGPVKEKTKEGAPQISDEVLHVPFPYKLDQVCKPCLRSHRISHRDGNFCGNSTKRHCWVRPAYWSEDGKVEVRIPRSDSLKLCQSQPCPYKEDCRHPHNEIERKVWTWLKNHKVTLDAAWESSHDGRTAGKKEEDNSTFTPRLELYLQQFQKLYPDLAKTYDIFLSCSDCQDSRNRWMDIDLIEKKHGCKRDALLIRRRGQRTWCHIRPRPNRPRPYLFELCTNRESENGCHPKCIYPHSAVEKKIWEDGKLDVVKLIRDIRKHVPADV